MSAQLELRVRLGGGDGWLLVNGLVAAGLKRGCWTQLPAAEYFSSGTNQIQIKGCPVQEWAPMQSMDCSADLLHRQFNQERGRWLERSLFSRSMQAEISGYALKTFEGVVVDLEFDMPIELPKWQFLGLPQSSCGPEGERRVQEFLGEMLAYLCKGEIEQVQRLFASHFKEMAEARGRPLSALMSSARQMLSELSEGLRSNSQVQRSAARLLPLRGGSVFYPLNDLGQPFFSCISPKTGREISLPIHLAPIGAKVYIVR